jgi:hypothetical protein
MGEEISNRKGSFGRHTSARFVVVVGSCKGAEQWRKGAGCREALMVARLSLVLWVTVSFMAVEEEEEIEAMVDGVGLFLRLSVHRGAGLPMATIIGELEGRSRWPERRRMKTWRGYSSRLRVKEML